MRTRSSDQLTAGDPGRSSGDAGVSLALPVEQTSQDLPSHQRDASVAQLDRASVFGTEGLRFESSRVHFFFSRGLLPRRPPESFGGSSCPTADVSNRHNVGGRREPTLLARHTPSWSNPLLQVLLPTPYNPDLIYFNRLRISILPDRRLAH